MNEQQVVAEAVRQINEFYSRNWSDIGCYLMSCLFYIMFFKQRLSPGPLATSLAAFALSAMTYAISLTMLQQALSFVVATLLMSPLAMLLSARYNSLHRQ